LNELCISNGTGHCNPPFTSVASRSDLSLSKGALIMVRRAHHDRKGVKTFHYFCKTQQYINQQEREVNQDGDVRGAD